MMFSQNNEWKREKPRPADDEFSFLEFHLISFLILFISVVLLSYFYKARAVHVRPWAPLESGWSWHRDDPVDPLAHVSRSLGTRKEGGRRKREANPEPPPPETDVVSWIAAHVQTHVTVPHIRLVSSVLLPREPHTLTPVQHGMQLPQTAFWKNKAQIK